MGKPISMPKSRGQLTKSSYKSGYTSKKQPKFKLVEVTISQFASTKPSWWDEHFKKQK